MAIGDPDATRMPMRQMTPMLSALYQDRLLAEYRAPKNRRELVDATSHAERKNPVCGDAVQIMVRVERDAIADVAFMGQGCAISTASASLLTQAVAHCETASTLGLVASVGLLLGGEAVDDLPELLDPLRGAVRFSSRHSCVLLPWLALRDALTQGEATRHKRF